MSTPALLSLSELASGPPVESTADAESVVVEASLLVPQSHPR